MKIRNVSVLRWVLEFMAISIGFCCLLFSPLILYLEFGGASVILEFALLISFYFIYRESSHRELFGLHYWNELTPINRVCRNCGAAQRKVWVIDGFTWIEV